MMSYFKLLWNFRISFFFKFYNSRTLLDFNALTVVGALMTLIDFTLSDARRFYSSMGNRLAVKGLRDLLINVKHF